MARLTLSMSGHFGAFIKKLNKTERIFMDFYMKICSLNYDNFHGNFGDKC